MCSVSTTPHADTFEFAVRASIAVRGGVRRLRVVDRGEHHGERFRGNAVDGAHGEHRHVAPAQHPFGRAAEERVREAGARVRAHHDQVARVIFRDRQNSRHRRLVHCGGHRFDARGFALRGRIGDEVVALVVERLHLG
jgi:hypothetical protein